VGIYDIKLRHRFNVWTGFSSTNVGKNQMRNTSSGKLTYNLYGTFTGNAKNDDKTGESLRLRNLKS
jgi:hypothetical protein